MIGVTSDFSLNKIIDVKMNHVYEMCTTKIHLGFFN